MQDYNYIVGDCFELTLELNEDKNPAASQLERLWNENKQAFVNFALVTALGGFNGVVTDREKNPLRARIMIEGISKTVHSRPEFGDFYRPLSPGIYNVTVIAKGFYSKSVEISVPEDGSGYQRNFRLRPNEDASRSRLRTMNSSGLNQMESQSKWVFNLSLFLIFTLCVTYGIQRLRKLNRRQFPRVSPLR